MKGVGGLSSEEAVTGRRGAELVQALMEDGKADVPPGNLIRQNEGNRCSSSHGTGDAHRTAGRP